MNETGPQHLLKLRWLKMGRPFLARMISPRPVLLNKDGEIFFLSPPGSLASDNFLKHFLVVKMGMWVGSVLTTSTVWRERS